MSNEDNKGFPYITEDCIYCGLCAKKCPADAILVNRKEKSWEVDENRCIRYGLCTP